MTSAVASNAFLAKFSGKIHALNKDGIPVTIDHQKYPIQPQEPSLPPKPRVFKRKPMFPKPPTTVYMTDSLQDEYVREEEELHDLYRGIKDDVAISEEEIAAKVANVNSGIAERNHPQINAPSPKKTNQHNHSHNHHQKQQHHQQQNDYNQHNHSSKSLSPDLAHDARSGHHYHQAQPEKSMGELESWFMDKLKHAKLWGLRELHDTSEFLQRYLESHEGWTFNDFNSQSTFHDTEFEQFDLVATHPAEPGYIPQMTPSPSFYPRTKSFAPMPTNIIPPLPPTHKTVQQTPSFPNSFNIANSQPPHLPPIPQQHQQQSFSRIIPSSSAYFQQPTAIVPSPSILPSTLGLHHTSSKVVHQQPQPTAPYFANTTSYINPRPPLQPPPQHHAGMGGRPPRIPYTEPPKQPTTLPPINPNTNTSKVLNNGSTQNMRKSYSIQSFQSGCSRLSNKSNATSRTSLKATSYHSLGLLGPDRENDDYRQKIAKLQRVKSYASRLRAGHQASLPRLPPHRSKTEEELEKNELSLKKDFVLRNGETLDVVIEKNKARQKMLEYASNVPKPSPPPKKLPITLPPLFGSHNTLMQNRKNERNAIRELEEAHNRDREAVERIRKELGMLQT